MPCMDCAAVVIETQDGEIVCENCVELHHSRCTRCGAWYRNGSSCTECATCEQCTTTVAQTQTVTTVHGSTICALCRQEWYWQCDVCDAWHHNYDGGCDNGCDPDGCECEDCRDQGELPSRCDLVHDYSYKPAPVFYGTGPLFLGSEIEIEAPLYQVDECAEIAQSYLGRLGYLKADSSIDNGFEIVTHPMAYEWAMANFPWQMLSQLHDHGCVATNSTGIHVHVSRAGFTSTCHTYRWMKFIYRNASQVKRVARRSSDTWAAFHDDDRQAVKDYARGACGRRYRAINTNNVDTFELRVFASSLNPHEVQAALGLTAASVEYTRDLTVHKIAHSGGWGWPAFVAWLTDRPVYQPLTQQLEQLQCVC